MHSNKAKRFMDARLGFDFQPASAFTSLAALTGLMLITWPQFWRRKAVGVSPVFGFLLRRVHQLRTSSFANRPSRPDLLMPRAQLVEEARARIRQEKVFFSRRTDEY